MCHDKIEVQNEEVKWGWCCLLLVECGNTNHPSKDIHPMDGFRKNSKSQGTLWRRGGVFIILLIVQFEFITTVIPLPFNFHVYKYIYQLCGFIHFCQGTRTLLYIYNLCFPIGFQHTLCIFNILCFHLQNLFNVTVNTCIYIFSYKSMVCFMCQMLAQTLGKALVHNRCSIKLQGFLKMVLMISCQYSVTTEELGEGATQVAANNKRTNETL